jgi:C-methyltransferase C-terminal domain/Putative zinc binding domain/Methyltransferase domain
MNIQDLHVLSKTDVGQEANAAGDCRLCGRALHHTFVDLGMSPLCEAILDAAQLDEMERFFPLRPRVCHECFLVQLEEYVAPEDIFDDRYPYFSSFSDSWVEHAGRYADAAIERLSLDGSSFVVEIGSNDGYLLQHFVARGIPVLGVEPAPNVAAAATGRGIRTLVRFFGTDTAREIAAEHGPADLIVGNNVLAQTPHLNDFVGGQKALLARDGVITMEFPHLLRLVAGNQFDTIYHEHFSYFSFMTAEAVFAEHGLTVFDVEELATHGGSLRIFARHADDVTKPVTAAVTELRERELAAGVHDLFFYETFAENVKRAKRDLLQFLIDAKREGKSVVAYGAPGKGNTLLNYCGIRQDLVDFAVDRNPHKHGKFTPGTHIPIRHPSALEEEKPDYVLILPWNLANEIIEQVAYIRDWGGHFVVPIPEVRVLEE